NLREELRREYSSLKQWDASVSITARQLCDAILRSVEARFGAGWKEIVTKELGIRRSEDIGRIVYDGLIAEGLTRATAGDSPGLAAWRGRIDNALLQDLVQRIQGPRNRHDSRIRDVAVLQATEHRLVHPRAFGDVGQAQLRLFSQLAQVSDE